MQPQLYRCLLCGKWITYSDYVIKGLISGTVPSDRLSLVAHEFLSQKNPDVSEADLVYYGDARDRNGTLRNIRYHYLCVKDQPEVVKRLSRKTRHKTAGIILPIPYVKGLEHLRED